jgi:hypothetical protein
MNGQFPFVDGILVLSEYETVIVLSDIEFEDSIGLDVTAYHILN